MGGVSQEIRNDLVQLRHLAPELRRLLGASGGRIPSGGGGLGAAGWSLAPIKFTLSGDSVQHTVAAFSYQATGGTRYLAWGIEQPDGAATGAFLWEFQFAAAAADLALDGINYNVTRTRSNAVGSETVEHWNGSAWAVVLWVANVNDTSIRTTDTTTTHVFAPNGSGAAAFRALASADMPAGLVKALHATVNTSGAATVTNTTIATALDSYTIPASTLADGDQLEGRLVWYVYDDDGALLAGDFNVIPSIGGATLSTAIAQTLTIGNPPPKNVVSCFGVIDWTLAREGANARYTQLVKTNVMGGTGVDTPLDFVTTSGTIATTWASANALAFKLAFTNASLNISAWLRTSVVKYLASI